MCVVLVVLRLSLLPPSFQQQAGGGGSLSVHETCGNYSPPAVFLDFDMANPSAAVLPAPPPPQPDEPTEAEETAEVLKGVMQSFSTKEDMKAVRDAGLAVSALDAQANAKHQEMMLSIKGACGAQALARAQRRAASSSRHARPRSLVRVATCPCPQN